MSILSKIWTIGEKLLASDLNANFNALFKQSYTASGGISANDFVYVNAANTVKTFGPLAMGTGASVTAPAHALAMRSKQLSAANRYLHFSGGEKDNSQPLYAQIRELNAGETNFTNGTEQAVYNTGNGVRWYDVAEISTDKFLVTFQADTGGSPVGIKCVVVSVSGDTITIGSVAAVETTGAFSAWNTVAKLDTDKALIGYTKDSDGDIYVKVCTVSGTTITQNTAVLVKTTSSSNRMCSAQLTTDKVLFIYSSNSDLFGRTIDVSGTTPTVNAEQTIMTGATSWMMAVAAISVTKAVVCYADDGSGAFSNETRQANLAISGSTITVSTSAAISTERVTRYIGISIIGTNYALFACGRTTTSGRVTFMNISGTNPSVISTQDLSNNSHGNNWVGIGLVKVSPFTYSYSSPDGSGVYLIKLTTASTSRIGVAEAAIADTVAGNILSRYQTQELSGITLVAGSTYYIDDNGQPTLKSSLTTSIYGVAISTTKILIL